MVIEVQFCTVCVWLPVDHVVHVQCGYEGPPDPVHAHQCPKCRQFLKVEKAAEPIVPDLVDDGSIMPIEEILRCLSAEFRRAESSPGLRRSGTLARLAAEMRELHEVLTTQRKIAALKTAEFKKEHPEIYKQLFG